MRLAISVLCLAEAISPVAQPQTTSQIPPLVERAEVHLVNVDVVVRDSSGRPVSGLKAEDFEVLEDGQQQPVAGFYAVEDAAVRLARGDDPLKKEADRFRRKFVLMIDNNSVQKPHRDAAIEFIGQFIDHQYAEDYEWSVLSIGSEVETLQPFTTDKEAIRTALLKARRKPTLVQQGEIDRGVLSDPGRGNLRDRHPDRYYDFGETARFQSQEQTKRNMLAIMNSAKAVIQTCRAYSAAGGKKALVLLTGGMELNTTFGAFDKGSADRNLLDTKLAIEQMLNTMAREANAANFKIYVVKAGGHHSAVPQHDVSNRGAGLAGSPKNPFFGEGYTSVADSSNVDFAPLSLAMQTGGRYFPSARANESLEEIDQETSNFYSLAFKPRSQEDGRYHRIEVRVKRPDVQVRHRAGYAAMSSHQRLEQSLRAPITFAKEKGTLPVTLQLGAAVKAEKDKPVIALSAAMPLRSITTIPRGNHRAGRVHIYLSIYDSTGENVGYHHQIRDLKLPLTQAAGHEQLMFQHPMKIALKRGNFTLVVTVRDELSDEVGTAFEDVKL